METCSAFPIPGTAQRYRCFDREAQALFARVDAGERGVADQVDGGFLDLYLEFAERVEGLQEAIVDFTRGGAGEGESVGFGHGRCSISHRELGMLPRSLWQTPRDNVGSGGRQ